MILHKGSGYMVKLLWTADLFVRSVLKMRFMATSRGNLVTALVLALINGPEIYLYGIFMSL